MLSTAYLEGLLARTESAVKFGLDNMRRALELFDNPQRQYRSVLVAGTNGKGTTAAFIAEGLRGAGYRTALYSSPHIQGLNERLCIDGALIGDDELRELLEGSLEFCRARGVELTFFELITLAAIRWFARAQVDFAVVEVGLGGRLDATNVHPADISIVTSIGLEHQAWLGDDLPSIAAEKLAIAKPGKPLITGAAEGWRDALSEAIGATGCIHVESTHLPLDAQVLEALEWEGFAANFRHAQCALDMLGVRDVELLRRAARVRVRGRMERRRYKNACMLIDAAHNAPAIAHVRERVHDFACREHRGPRCRSMLITTLLEDKPLDSTIREFWEGFHLVVLVALQNPRGRRFEDLFALRAQLDHQRVFIASSAEHAVSALQNFLRGQAEFRIVLAGSIYLLGEMLPLLEPDFEDVSS